MPRRAFDEYILWILSNINICIFWLIVNIILCV
jgi:hypothetical protein